MKIQWHGWIKHVASVHWHDIVQSEDFDTVVNTVKKYVKDNHVKDNHVTVKFYVLCTTHVPDGLPRDFMEPLELRG